MIMINNTWEFGTQENILKLIRENLGSEFADKCECLFDNNDKIIDLEDKISDLESELDDLTNHLDNYDNLLDRIGNYESNIEEVEKEILQNDDGDSEYYKGMQKALDMFKGEGE